MNWINAEEAKPPAYKTVLLQLGRDEWTCTTGWWAKDANDGHGAWIGLAFNQSPPIFDIMAGAVIAWCDFERPPVVRSG